MPIRIALDEQVRARPYLHGLCSLVLAITLWSCGGDATQVSRDVPFEGTAHPELVAHSGEFERGVVRVTDGVYVAIGYGLANSILLEGDDGVVIVDTMSVRSEAEAVLEAFRAAASTQPVKAVILTHNHADHVYGGAVFTAAGNDVPVYAHETTEYYIDRIISQIQDSIFVRAMRMFGTMLPPEDVPNAGIGPHLGYQVEGLALARPTHVFSDRLDIEVAGIRMTLVHAPGETPDQLFVWLPEQRVLLPGDNVYRAFPNLYTIRGTAYRDVMDWVASLDKMRALEPAFLVPSHTRPVTGEAEIEDVLTAYRDAIQYVHDQTVRGLNKGMTPDEIVDWVRLPPHLEEHPFLRPFYGTVAWSVRSIFTGYLGWFGGDATTLDLLRPEERSQRFAAALGKGQPLIEQTRQALADGDYAWAAELADHLVRAAPSEEAKALKADAFQALGERHVSANGRHYYLSQARELRGELEIRPTDRSSIPDAFIEDLPIAGFMHTMPVRLKAEETLEMDRVVGFRFTDVDQSFTFHIRRGVAEVRPGLPEREDADLVTTTAAVWKSIVFKKRNPAAAFVSGDLKVEGGVFDVASFLNLFER